MTALDPSQLAAVELMLSARAGVVTGGPGTGKTTTTRAALDALDARGETYLLAAPTGKAARRMREATGREASTIHRLLGWAGDGFVHHQGMPLMCDAVVIDEASMIDIELASALFAAVHPLRTRLILVGDRNQLPSVGAGAVFADLIASGLVPVAELTRMHRSAAGSWVAQQAPRILAGEMPDLESRDDFQWCPMPDAHAAAQAAVGFAGSLGAQILAPQRTGACGVDAINLLAQERLNPPIDGKHSTRLGKLTLREGDPVMQLKNDYARGVMNGEVGRVVGAVKGMVTVDFDGVKSQYAAGDASALDLAYATTVHKSQGSEYPWVAVVCHSSHTHMLGRQLIYTAITRAKQGVVLVGDEKGLQRAIKNTRDARRNTTLAARMRAMAAEAVA